MIISFAWTAPQLLSGIKTVTRRVWDFSYAKKFNVGDLVDAYDRNPRFKGKKIATIKIKDLRLVVLEDMDDADLKREGLAEIFVNPEQFIKWFIQKNGGTRTQKVWRLEFEIVKQEEEK